MSATQYVTSPQYSSLVNMIKTYLSVDNDETVNMIPFFINVSEKVIARNLRMPSMEKIISLTLEADSYSGEGWVNIPYDYLEMKFVWTGCSTFQRVTFDQIIQYGIMGTDFVGDPCWAINADRIYFIGVGKTTEIFMTYYSDVPEISQDLQSNIYLDLLPDAFLYLAVAEGFRFLMEEEKCNYWEQLGLQRVNAVKQQVYDAEFSGSPLVISPLSTN